MSERYGRLEEEDDDAARLADLYRRYAGWLADRLRRRFGDDLAEDLVQETYLRVAPFNQAGEIRHPRAFLLRVATNLGVDLGRRAARARAASPPSRPYAEASQFDDLLLREVVLSLPTPLQDVFVLSRFAGLTYEEIAARLGLSVKTVEWRMSRALAHCTARLRP